MAADTLPEVPNLQHIPADRLVVTPSAKGYRYGRLIPLKLGG